MILLAFAAATLAQPAPAPAHPAHHAAPAPAATTAARLSTGTTTIGALLGNPAAKAIVAKHLPSLTSHPQLNQALGMTLRAAMPYSQGMITAGHLDAIDAELAALPAA